MNRQDAAPRPMPTDAPVDVLLLLLYAPGQSGQFGEPIQGVTRLQKLFFLLNRGEGPKTLAEAAAGIEFRAYKMGPFSASLRDTVEDLEAARIVTTHRMKYLLPDDNDGFDDEEPEDGGRGERVTSLGFRLSPDRGMLIGRDLWAGLSKEQQQALAEFKRFFNSLSLRQLLIFTYEKFPAYTTKSIIKRQLGLD